MELVRLITICLKQKHSKVLIGKAFADNFSMQNGLKQGAALSPLLFNFALEYTTRKVPENQVGMKLNGTHHLLVYANDVILLSDNINTIKNTQTLIDASKEVGLEVNTEKTKYMLLSRHQNARQNHDIKLADRCFENVEQFRHLETTKANQNLILKKINSRFNSG
jgi:ABC-type lipoprotein release transport system permease subunit